MSEERAVVSTTGTAMSSMFEFGGNIERAWKFADVLSRSKIIPDTFQGNPASVLIALDMANRMRRNPLEVMQAMYIVHGKPSFSSSFLISLINSCGFYEPLRFRLSGEGANRSCVAWTVDKRTGEKVEGPEVSIAMAKTEGWYDKNGSKWKTMPEVMLRYRAASFFSRAYCPDLTGGFHSQEEALDSMESVNHGVGALSSQDLQAQIVGAAPSQEEPLKLPAEFGEAEEVAVSKMETTTAQEPPLAPINPIPVEPDAPAFPEDAKQEPPKQPTEPITTKKGPFSELEKLRLEVTDIMGPEGLDYTFDEQAEFFFKHGGDTVLNNIKAPKLAKILSEARVLLQKKDAEAARGGHAGDEPVQDTATLPMFAEEK